MDGGLRMGHERRYAEGTTTTRVGHPDLEGAVGVAPKNTHRQRRCVRHGEVGPAWTWPHEGGLDLAT